MRVRLVDGSYHTVDSSEMAFKIAGSMAFKQAYAEADPVLLEPIMRLEITVPEENVGDVIGDMTSRRGRRAGHGSRGPARTIVHVEVPMAEMLTYAPDLTSMTGGRGDYSMALPALRGGAAARGPAGRRAGEEGAGARLDRRIARSRKPAAMRRATMPAPRPVR